jgi:hypothetical protein
LKDVQNNDDIEYTTEAVFSQQESARGRSAAVYKGEQSALPPFLSRPQALTRDTEANNENYIFLTVIGIVP